MEEFVPHVDRFLFDTATASKGGSGGAGVLSDVRARLDDDLDTPGALRVIDEAAAAGSDVSDAAALLGVSLN